MDMKLLGKIEKAVVGLGGGSPDTAFGVTFTLGGQSLHVSTFTMIWPDPNVEMTNEWRDGLAKERRFLQDLMADARVDSVDRLVNKPVEATFDGNLLKSWRILTEVL